MDPRINSNVPSESSSPLSTKVEEIKVQVQTQLEPLQGHSPESVARDVWTGFPLQWLARNILGEERTARLEEKAKEFLPDRSFYEMIFGEPEPKIVIEDEVTESLPQPKEIIAEVVEEEAFAPQLQSYPTESKTPDSPEPQSQGTTFSYNGQDIHLVWNGRDELNSSIARGLDVLNQRGSRGMRGCSGYWFDDLIFVMKKPSLELDLDKETPEEVTSVESTTPMALRSRTPFQSLLPPLPLPLPLPFSSEGEKTTPVLPTLVLSDDSVPESELPTSEEVIHGEAHFAVAAEGEDDDSQTPVPVVVAQTEIARKENTKKEIFQGQRASGDPEKIRLAASDRERPVAETKEGKLDQGLALAVENSEDKLVVRRDVDSSLLSQAPVLSTTRRASYAATATKGEPSSENLGLTLSAVTMGAVSVATHSVRQQTLSVLSARELDVLAAMNGDSARFAGLAGAYHYSRSAAGSDRHSSNESATFAEEASARLTTTVSESTSSGFDGRPSQEPVEWTALA